MLRKSILLFAIVLSVFFLMSCNKKDNTITTDLIENSTSVKFEKDIIENVMNKSSWNKSEAARMLNIPRTTLIYKIDLYGIKEKSEKKSKKTKKNQTV